MGLKTRREALAGQHHGGVFPAAVGQHEVIEPMRQGLAGDRHANTLAPAYAATIHKSQSSEYPAAVVPVLTQHFAMLQYTLICTGVTRGKKLVVLVGQKKALAIAVKDVSGRRRWSKLGEWLAETAGETADVFGRV